MQRGIQLFKQEVTFTDKAHLIAVPHDLLPEPLPVDNCKDDALQFAMTFWIKPLGANDANRTPAIWITEGKATVCYVVSCQNNGNTNRESVKPLELNKYVHMAYLVHGQSVTVYMDGVHDSTMTLNSKIVYNTDKLCIGGDAWYKPALAAMKHFRWYNFALSQEQILQDAQSDDLITIHAITSKELTLDYGNMLNDTATSDVTLLVENQSIPAHKVILKHRSEYFALLFASGMKEATEKQVVIDCKYELFRKILLFIYSGQLQLKNESADTLFNLYQEFNKYLLHDAEQACLEYLQIHIQADVQFAFQLLVSSVNAGHNKITQHCIASIAKKFGQAVSNNSFFSLPQELQRDVLVYMVNHGMVSNE